MAPVNETDMVLLPEGLNALKKVAKEVGLDLRGAYLNLDGGFDSAHNRKCIFNAGMIPNIPENPRNRKRTKRGRKRFFNEAIHALRVRVERTFAWEDKFKRLLLRFEHIQQRNPRQNFHIPPDLVVECVTAHRKPPEVRIWTLRNQSAVGTRPPSTSTPD